MAAICAVRAYAGLCAARAARVICDLRYAARYAAPGTRQRKLINGLMINAS